MSRERLFTAEVGRVRALESRLAGREKLARLARENSMDAVSRAAREAGYAAPGEQESDPVLENWFAGELRSARRLARELFGRSGYRFFYLFSLDQFNLFQLCRRPEEAEPDEPEPESGFFSWPVLRDAFAGRGLFRLPGVLGRAINRVNAGEAKDFPEKENILSSALHRLMRLEADGRPLLLRLARARTDRVNIRRRLNGENLLAESGLLPLDTLAQPGREGKLPEEIIRALKFHYPPVGELVEAWNRAEKGGSTSGRQIEDAFEKLEEEALKPARLASFGPEPLLAYLSAREREVVFLRRLMFSLRKGGA